MLHFVLASIAYHLRIHFAVALGVAAATAVLTGALIVGDSMRGSLRHLTLDRLGRIDELLIVDRFFREELASEVATNPNFKASGYQEVVPAILLPSCSLERQSERGTERGANIMLVAADERFSKLAIGNETPVIPSADDEIIVNEPLAAELHAKVGDMLTIRMPSAEQVPADSPLGKKDGRVASVTELKLVKIVPADGLGRFSLRPNQGLPRNAYVRPAKIQEALDQNGRMNALLVAGDDTGKLASADMHAKLTLALEPKLTDYGLTLSHVTRDWNNEKVFDYFQLTSDRMLIDPAVATSAQKALADDHPQLLFTYLATRIERITSDAAERKKQERYPIPYSTIAAVDATTDLGPYLDSDGKVIGPPKESEIVLTSWAAEDREAKLGEEIRVSYFEPETTHGEEKVTSKVFKLIGIAPLTEPSEPFTRRGPAVYEERPTKANDTDLTPVVKGLTDKASIADWNAPFDMDSRLIRSNDDSYWENHRTTPKGYISLAEGQKLWGSRWGNVTSIRVPARDGMTTELLSERILAQIKTDGVNLGFEFQPIKQRDLAASSGTTPFDVLFLALSFFVMTAALILVLLLFRLGVEQRASEMGVLLGFGWTRARVARWLLVEGAIVSAAGALLGIVAGIAYAWLMLVGLRTWWIGAVSTPFLELYITPRSLVIGYASGIIVSLLAIYWGVRQTRSVAVRRLLAGQLQDQPSGAAPTVHSWVGIVVILLTLCATGCATLAATLRGEAQAGAFLGSGALVLTIVLMIVREHLRTGLNGISLLSSPALPRLAMRNAARSPARSLLTLALVAAASFLIVALSAFRLDPTKSGSGGFELIGQSSQALHRDLQNEKDREEMLADDAALLSGGEVLSLRLQPGDDASCRNLYQPLQPRVLGVPSTLIEYYDRPERTPFAWSASAAKSAQEKQNPWHVLEQAETDEAVPVVLDQNTAMYSLKLYGGVGETFEVTYPNNQTVKFRVAGLLSNSVFQGSLLVSERDFKRLFPEISGYRYFLIAAAPGKTQELSAALENRLSDEGFDVERASVLLTDLLAVQNTYLSTFQALGALGLMLGTFGVAAVQLRNIFERRGELGLLRAEGFSNARLAALVMLENIVLLVGGLVIGVIAALIAVLPHMFLGGAQPPLLNLALMLGIVAVVGCAVGLIAVRGVLKVPVIAALRGE